MTKIEHANITVPDIDEAINFIKVVAPDFQVRKDERPSESFRWVHIGNDKYYFALQEPHIGSPAEHPKETYKNFGVNHIALVVENIERIESALLEAGYRRGIYAPSEKYRKRLYFYDGFGFEWELVEYFSEKVKEKFLYE